MKAVFFLFLFLTASLPVRSQHFIVTHPGDTLWGEIKLNGKEIALLKSDGTTRIFPADDIAYIHNSRYTGTVLHTRLTLYSDNIDVVQKWDYKGGDIIDTVMVLKLVFKSKKMDLFQAVDKDKAMYYFVKKPTDSLPIQMIVKYGIQTYGDRVFLRNDAVVSVLAQQRRYIDQLTLMMIDCDKITLADLNMMDYRIYSFKKIIRRYNKCK